MQEWWISLTGVQQLLWGLAIPFTLLFMLQMVVALFIGADDGDGGDHDGSGDASMFFTLRNAIVFFLGFSWGGLACVEAGISIVWAILIGLFMVALNLLLLKGLATLNESGNIDLENTVGKEAIVSISIPGKFGGCGKVNISFQGRLEELEAITEGEKITRGHTVKVVRVSNNQLIVNPLEI
ncbi:MAG: hypothetical protein DRQ49_19800 [Gammaproteobacteria bacterium]|nr:MAG: hypothetical protein DRQ49_19800 [Gammaproteobacteria bacterium]RKZ38956.1 MAG: hypothetical protein DRQ41_11265 [Gammaproteobacteria bacterium]RKZ73450.1 MAG: hypothetical protein DRQ57_14360 [Gammaproteobacteria bacterium]